MDYSDWAPRDVRALISAGKLQGQTSGMCAGYAQANLCILPKAQAFDFLLFCMRNPRPCPILEVGEAGCRQMGAMARGDDVCTAFPKYRIWRGGAGGRSNGYFRLLAGRFGVLPYRLFL